MNRPLVVAFLFASWLIVPLCAQVEAAPHNIPNPSGSVQPVPPVGPGPPSGGGQSAPSGTDEVAGSDSGPQSTTTEGDSFGAVGKVDLPASLPKKAKATIESFVASLEAGTDYSADEQQAIADLIDALKNCVEASPDNWKDCLATATTASASIQTSQPAPNLPGHLVGAGLPLPIALGSRDGDALQSLPGQLDKTKTLHVRLPDESATDDKTFGKLAQSAERLGKMSRGAKKAAATIVASYSDCLKHNGSKHSEDCYSAAIAALSSYEMKLIASQAKRRTRDAQMASPNSDYGNGPKAGNAEPTGRTSPPFGLHPGLG